MAFGGEEALVIAARLLCQQKEWEGETYRRELSAQVALRLNAFHRSRRNSVGYALKRALRSKRYTPNGRGECARRIMQINSGQCKFDNGFVPYVPDWLREAA